MTFLHLPRVYIFRRLASPSPDIFWLSSSQLKRQSFSMAWITFKCVYIQTQIRKAYIMKLVSRSSCFKTIIGLDIPFFVALVNSCFFPAKRSLSNFSWTIIPNTLLSVCTTELDHVPTALSNCPAFPWCHPHSTITQAFHILLQTKPTCPFRWHYDPFIMYINT